VIELALEDLSIISTLLISLIGFIGINIKILIIAKINHNNINETDIEKYKKRVDEINQISNQIINSIKF